MFNNSIKSMFFGGHLKKADIKGFKGFTLAEVLITLVIIGVIAAMTIPTLINKTNNQEYVTRLKKVYSTLGQASNKIIAEEGSPKAWAVSNENVYNLYKKHLQIAKDCGQTGECFPDVVYKRLNNTTLSGLHSRTNLYSVKLADGASVIFGWANNGLCNKNNSGTNNYCTLIDVDLNAEKGPNAYGYDFFTFALTENGFYPAGCDTDECDNSNNGGGCACKVLREGAINY